MTMVTVFRVRGVRVMMYSNDHWPPHVHAIGANGDAKIALGRTNPQPYVMANAGLSRSEMEAVMAIIRRDREQLKQRWRKIHGLCELD